MAMQLGALRTALPRAAEEAASYETRLAGLETRVAVVAWMVRAHIALTVLTLGVLLTLASKLGEISGQIMHMGH